LSNHINIKHIFGDLYRGEMKFIIYNNFYSVSSIRFSITKKKNKYKCILSGLLGNTVATPVLSFTFRIKEN
jgi:hypothetical protein